MGHTAWSRPNIWGFQHPLVDAFGLDGGFILSPVDALFPDTPESNFEAMLDVWYEVREN